MEKSYYAYCRPKQPNHPWSLEVIPFGRSILSVSKPSIDLKGNKSMTFDTKELDEIGVSMKGDSIMLPIGKYVVDFTSLIETPVASDIIISIDSYKFCSSSSAGIPITLNGKFLLKVADDKKDIKITNESKDTVKISNATLFINKI